MKRICLVVADATRARIFTYERLAEPGGPREEFREEADLVDPERRRQPHELYTDDAGQGRNGPHSYAFDDHRQDHRDRLDKEFAHEIAAAVEKIVKAQGFRELVVLANARMLGALRQRFGAFERMSSISYLDRDFTALSPHALRERLAELELLPPRAFQQAVSA